MIKTGWVPLENENKLIRVVILWTLTQRRPSLIHQAKTFIHQFFADTGCCQEDLANAMERERERERERESKKERKEETDRQRSRESVWNPRCRYNSMMKIKSMKTNSTSMTRKSSKHLCVTYGNTEQAFWHY